MNKDALAQIQQLKSDVNGVHRFVDGENKYGLLIIARGELLFFQENDKALICDVSARYALINPATIKKWDNGDKISDAEREEIVQKIILYYKKAYRDDLKIFKE
ncbi:hypothetical protein HGH92_23120 [Chitinophaga varians]|uniref:Uncharacterized protein n=1 Tax=Chitinophaga varians TaxID=2202339 RepID=A0A847S2C2_9BACT|nr:hypothetical protein [Chitinophaga varians]NLR67218.1 hypothetical protein [Chitinophaga varians]